jgi:hypothetical protein
MPTFSVSIEFMFLLTILLHLSAGWASTHSLKVPHSMALLEAPREKARVLFLLNKGEELLVLAENARFAKVSGQRRGKPFYGYIMKSQLAQAAFSAVQGPNWIVLAGATYSRLDQNGKSFQDEGQTTYNMTSFGSVTAWPVLGLQWGSVEFWRAILGARTTRFTGAVGKDIVGTSRSPVEVEHRFLTLQLQKAWSPWAWKRFHIGLGGEYSRATMVKVKIDGVQLATTSQDLPSYIGAHAFLGGQAPLYKSVWLWGEGRLGGILNQKPFIINSEVYVGLGWAL